MAPPPNIVFFFTDQQRHDTVGLHGNPLGLTPNFDRLAREGTFLKNCFSCQPLCTPARASLQTGRYASQSGLSAGVLSAGSRTLADHFNEAGYDTALIGKWHLAGTDPVPERLQGRYASWLGSNTPDLSSGVYGCRLYDKEKNAVDLPGYRSDAYVDAAIRYLSEPRENPFFLFLSLVEPHQHNPQDSYPAPDGYRELYSDRWTPPDLAAMEGSAARQLPGYYGMVKRVDEGLGRVADALKSMGMLENTLIVYASDHGCHFRTRGHEYKHTCHESSIRVPGFIHGPGFLAGGERPEMVSLVDLPPTLLDAAGLSVPGEMQGQSLVPRLRSSISEWPGEAYVEYENPTGTGRAIRTGRWKFAVQTDQRELPEAGCADEYREAFLYDLEADPWEQENCIGLEGYREVAEQLRERLLKRLEKVEGKRPTILPPLKVNFSGQRKIARESGEL
ncbi:sulfatase-like hydrolase/transferase [Puniceicoccus vermicola]|uniref:Sulfatase-like hydrolase/transferase n=1 Tax=Puniceicoccus vermicola TaxID=388746 RepID=A0A7X1AZ27_9BACT|nr:sulfatase-like hydrolase/transferase [Puniceicoccus vermicola]MBC2602618.1 sulfatase-like hydrolase/transferase [Puniceicoccus vermicola]